MSAGGALAPEALTARGWARDVALRWDEAGRLASVEPGAADPSLPRLPGPVLPGLCCLHSHAFQRAMAGLAERRGPTADSFWTWRETMYAFLGALTPKDVGAVAACLYADLLEGGYTSVGEFHYLHHAPDGAPYADVGEMAARIADAAGDAGIGLTLLPVHYARGGLGGEPLGPGQRRFATSLDLFARLLERCEALAAGLPGAAVGVAPHSLRAVAPADFAPLLAMAGDRPFHLHAAEQPAEVAACLEHLGAPPVRWLLDHLPVDRRWVLVHATHAGEEELAGLAAAGAAVALCPSTEASLGDGTFRLPALLGAGGRFGIGSDSNVGADAAEELRLLEGSQRLRDGARCVAALAGGSTGARLLERAGESAADALGRPVGRLAPGFSADFLVLDPLHPMLAGRSGEALADAFVFAAGRSAIDEVWVAGARRVAGGRHPARDRLRAGHARAVARLVAGR